MTDQPRLTNRRLRYARDPEYRLRHVNNRRRRQGKPLLDRPEDIGREFLAHCYSRTRDDQGRFQ